MQEYNSSSGRNSTTDRRKLTSPPISLGGISVFMKIQQAISEYIKWKAIRSPRAAEAYPVYLRRYSQWEKRDTKLIKAKDVVAFFEHTKQKYPSPTVCYFGRVLKNFFAYLNAIDECTVTSFLIQPIKYRRFERQAATEDEYRALVNKLNLWNYEGLLKYCVVTMLYYTGMRVSEVCEIDLNQMETDKNYISIKNKKNQKERWVMWPMEFHREQLLRYIGIRICLNKKPALFMAYHTRERLTRRSVERWFKDLSKEAGIRPIHPHLFRHGKAHRMRAMGADIQELQVVLGHASPMSCVNYLNMTKEEVLGMESRFLGS